MNCDYKHYSENPTQLGFKKGEKGKSFVPQCWANHHHLDLWITHFKCKVFFYIRLSPKRNIIPRVLATRRSMAQIRRMDCKVEVKSSADKFFDAFNTKAHLMPKMSTRLISDVKLLQGDWCSLGSVRMWYYVSQGINLNKYSLFLFLSVHSCFVALF